MRRAPGRALAVAALVLLALAVAWWWPGRPPAPLPPDAAAGAGGSRDQAGALQPEDKATNGAAGESPPPLQASARTPASGPGPAAPPRIGSREGLLAAMQAAPEPAPELEDLAALRARIRAGDGTAAWKMINHVHTCASATLLDDAQVVAQVRSTAARRPVPADEDGIDRALRELTAKDHEQRALRRMRELRHHCPQLRRDDGERLLDWLEVALAAGEEDFLYRLSIPGGLPLPQDPAWRVRHAERLADFLVRARQAYEARLGAGDRRLLERARFFYENNHLWPQVDAYKVLVHGLVQAG